MKVIAIIKYTFGLIGLALLIGAVYLHLDTREFLSSATKTQGSVIDFATHRSDGTTMYAPVVSYQARDGKTYEYISNTSSSSRSYDIGEQVGIFYLQDNPQDAKIDSFFQLYFGELILFILGGIFFLIGAGMMWAGISSNRKREYLQTQGRLIQAKFQEVGVNESLSVNGRHPFVILAQWLDPVTNKIHVFESDNIWFDPTEYIKDDTIPVYIQPDNPNRYWVDTRFLPSLAE